MYIDIDRAATTSPIRPRSSCTRSPTARATASTSPTAPACRPAPSTRRCAGSTRSASCDRTGRARRSPAASSAPRAATTRSPNPAPTRSRRRHEALRESRPPAARRAPCVSCCAASSASSRGSRPSQPPPRVPRRVGSRARRPTRPSRTRRSARSPDAVFLVRQQWSLDMLLQDLRYAAARAARSAPASPRSCADAGARHRRQHRGLQRRSTAVLLRPLPFRKPRRLVAVWENDRINLKPRYPVAPGELERLAQPERAFEHLAALHRRGRREPDDRRAIRSTSPCRSSAPNFFDVMGVRPVLGDVRPRRRHAAEPPRARLELRRWQSHFGSDPGVVGRRCRTTASRYRIVGVMPRISVPDRDVGRLAADGETPQTLAEPRAALPWRRRAPASPA